MPKLSLKRSFEAATHHVYFMPRGLFDLFGTSKDPIMHHLSWSVRFVNVTLFHTVRKGPEKLRSLIKCIRNNGGKHVNNREKPQRYLFPAAVSGYPVGMMDVGVSRMWNFNRFCLWYR